MYKEKIDITLFNFLIRFQLVYFKFINTVLKNRKLIFIDIDNTIADTQNYYVQDIVKKYRTLPPIKGVIDYIRQNYPQKHYKYVFITARHYRYFFHTQSWLLDQGFVRFGLIIVHHPKEKIKFLKSCSGNEHVYFDDLTFQNIRGEVVFYEEVIQIIPKNIKYYNYSLIQKLRENDI